MYQAHQLLLNNVGAFLILNKAKWKPKGIKHIIMGFFCKWGLYKKVRQISYVGNSIRLILC